MITADFFFGFLSCGILVSVIGLVITLMDMYKRSTYTSKYYKKYHVDDYWCMCIWCQLERKKKVDTGELDTVVMPVVKKTSKGFRGFKH